MTKTPMPYEWEAPDREGWNSGPWDDETDLVVTTCCGYSIVVLRITSGHLCGYVGVPLSHPAATGLLSVDGFSVHGGVTFHKPHDGLYWVGFDCAHAGDFGPKRHRSFGFTISGETYRTIPYVLAEAYSLAEQLAAPIDIPPDFTLSGRDFLRLRNLISVSYDSDLRKFFTELLEKAGIE